MKRAGIAVAGAVLSVVALAGCDLDDSSTPPNEPGGPGVTYNGKLGYDMGGGFVVPYDGSGVAPGFGY